MTSLSGMHASHQQMITSIGMVFLTTSKKAH